MHPYQQASNWQYGYTLGPSSAASNGAYTTYQAQAAAQAASAAAAATSHAAAASAYSSAATSPVAATGYAAGGGAAISSSYAQANSPAYRGDFAQRPYATRPAGVNVSNLKTASVTTKPPPAPSASSTTQALHNMYGTASRTAVATGGARPGVAATWSDVKPAMPAAEFKAKVFVTASDSKQASSSTASYTTPGGVASGTVANAAQSKLNAAAMPKIGPVQPDGAGDASAGDPDVQACMKLHELALYNKQVETYEKVESESVGGDFVMKLCLGNETYKGVGGSLKQAKQNAAAQALANTAFMKPAVKMTMKARPTGFTATSELHEMATRKGVRIDFKFLEPFNFEFKASMRMWSKREMMGNYRVQLTVAGYEFYGQAELPQQAKHNAAMQALPVVRALPDTSVKGGATTGVIVSDVVDKVDELAPELRNKNVIMALNEISMARQLTPTWEQIGEQGPPHLGSFSVKLKVGELECVGSGQSKQLARTSAAQTMINMMPAEWKKPKPKKRKSGSGRGASAAGGGIGRGGGFGVPHPPVGMGYGPPPAKLAAGPGRGRGFGSFYQDDHPPGYGMGYGPGYQGMMAYGGFGHWAWGAGPGLGGGPPKKKFSSDVALDGGGAGAAAGADEKADGDGGEGDKIDAVKTEAGDGGAASPPPAAANAAAVKAAQAKGDKAEEMKKIQALFEISTGDYGVRKPAQAHVGWHHQAAEAARKAEEAKKAPHETIQATNPISALYEYCKKTKQPDPEFECIAENVLETWEKQNKTFKKTEFTIKLEVAGKTFFGSANTKKLAKTVVATEAWDKIRAGAILGRDTD